MSQFGDRNSGFFNGAGSGGGGGGLTSVSTCNTNTFSFYGDGTSGNPLCGCPQISSFANQGLVALSDGLWSPNPIRNGLVYGGVVTWLNNYTYSVSAAGYYINGVFYTSPQTTVTLPPSDPTLDRIDLFVVTTSGTATSLTGTPNNPPQAPTINPDTELDVSFAFVQAGSVAPPVSSQYIYLNNAEWTTSVSAGSNINPASTSNPFSPPLDVEATNSPLNASITFTTAPFNILQTYGALIFYIRSKAAFPANRRLTFQFRNGATVVGQSVVLTGGVVPYGFNSATLGVYQRITIPLLDFGLNLGSVIDNLRIIVTANGAGAGTLGFFIDNIELQSANISPTVNIIYVPSLGFCSTIRCNVNNIATSCYSSSLSGRYNLINNTVSQYSSIVAGRCNNITSTQSFIGAGQCNTITGTQSNVILAGLCNISANTNGCFNTTINGRINCICTSGNHNTIVGNNNKLLGCAAGGNFVWGSNNTFCGQATFSTYGACNNLMGGELNQFCQNPSAGGKSASNNTIFGILNCICGCSKSQNFVHGLNNAIVDDPAFNPSGGWGNNNVVFGSGNRVQGTFGVNFVMGSNQRILVTDFDNYLWNSITGGRNNCITNGNSITIAGGCFNCVTMGAGSGLSGKSFIGGGRCNVITSFNQASISAGTLNLISGSLFEDSSIVGGNRNCITLGCSFIGGGCCNAVTNCFSSIVGGLQNISSSCFSSVVGGNCNTVSGVFSSIVAGQNNLAQGDISFIGGGECNNICNTTSCLALGSVVVGGIGNNTTGGIWNLATCSFTVAPTICTAGRYSFIGGGLQNRAGGSSSVVVGGQCNTAIQSFGTISGGYFHTSSACYTFTGSGFYNTTSANYAIVVGGFANISSGGRSFLGSGTENITSGCQAFVGNGTCNYATQSASFIGNGVCNCSCGEAAFIGNGFTNLLCGNYAFIGGGICNVICNSVAIACTVGSAIVGGVGNNTCGGVFNTGSCYFSTPPTRCNAGNYSFIGAGFQNVASGNRSSVVGGQLNNTCGFADAHIVGSCLCATQSCTTFVNCLSAANIPTGCAVCSTTNNVLVGYTVPNYNIGFYTQTANSTPITGTTTETTLIGSGVGTLTVPANTFSVGDSFVVIMGGLVSADNNQTLTIRIKSGSVVLVDSGAQTISNITNDVFTLNINFTIRQIGGTTVASIVTLGTFAYHKSSNSNVQSFAFDNVNNTTFDTTINNTLDITAQWGSTSGVNNICSDIFTLNKTY